MELFSFYQHIGIWTTVFVLLAIWDLVWKAIALWRAAQRKEVLWFIAILIVNSLGILPIIYLLLKSAPGKKSATVELKNTAESKKQETQKPIAKKAKASKRVAKKSTKKASKKKNRKK